MILRWKDPNPGIENHYRFVFDNNKPDSLLHFIRSDLNLTSEFDATGSGFRYLPNDMLTFKCYHIPKPYFEFYNSIRRAIQANSSPFAEANTIKSNIVGMKTIGIFTGLGQTRKQIIVKKPT